MTLNPNKGVKISSENGIRKTIFDFLKNTLTKGIFDTILIPAKVPAGDSYAWILLKETSLMDDTNPVPPVMAVQGAKALKSLTRKGEGQLNIAAIMRPCEIRASIELSKLNQVRLDKITLISYDCPGSIPFSDYIANPQESDKLFQSILSKGEFENEATKPVCRICSDLFCPSSDLHFGSLGSEGKSIFIIPNSEKGTRILDDLELACSEDTSSWNSQMTKLKEKKAGKREEIFKTIQPMIEGMDGLLKTFANCVGCHNCQSACPICYCRQCYFDSEVSKSTSQFLQTQAEKGGRLAFPQDKIMFHVGRMAHMSLSCVSCGLCTDACPVSIPVAQIFSYVSDKTQQACEYHAGNDAGEGHPLRQYQLDEIHEIHELVKSAEPQENRHE